jgi:tetratricopeptide (TPR) repeat protein
LEAGDIPLDPRARILALTALASLAACGDTGGAGFPGRDAVARNAPFGADPGAEGVDGLIVGHRLMEAEEYDLALKAYLRAAGEKGATVDVLSAIGSANLKLGRLGQAERILRQAVEIDPEFVPALNNLGVVLMERAEYGEARILFQRAFAADSGRTDSIRENLRRAIAESEEAVYAGAEEKPRFTLVRRGYGSYELLSEL